MSNLDSSLLRLAGALGSRKRLDQDDMSALFTLPYVRRLHEASAYVLQESEPLKTTCSFIISGYAFQHKLTSQGARQIVAINMPGEFIDLQQLFLASNDYNVQALTRLETIEIGRDALKALAFERPAIGEAIWLSNIVEASAYREWVLNIGRRDARMRIAHLFCELAARIDAAGGAVDNGSYEFSMTQEQIGDATGLTGVHVNRTLRTLADEGLVLRNKHFFSFTDRKRIEALADFDAAYLHLSQVTTDS